VRSESELIISNPRTALSDTSYSVSSHVCIDQADQGVNPKDRVTSTSLLTRSFRDAQARHQGFRWNHMSKITPLLNRLATSRPTRRRRWRRKELSFDVRERPRRLKHGEYRHRTMALPRQPCTERSREQAVRLPIHAQKGPPHRVEHALLVHGLWHNAFGKGRSCSQGCRLMRTGRANRLGM